MSQLTIQEQQERLINDRKELQRQIIEFWNNYNGGDQHEYEDLEYEFTESLKDSLKLAMNETPYNTKIIVDTLYELLKYEKSMRRYSGFSLTDSFNTEEIICYLFDNMKDEAFDGNLKYPTCKW